MIAVMGAAGHVGGKVAERLLDAGEPIRVLQHRRPLAHLAERGARVLEGDAADPGDLARLLSGADAALLLLPEDLSDPDFAGTRSAICRSLAAALAERPVGHLVGLSAVAAGRPDAVGPPAGLREFERTLLAQTGTHVLLLRSAFYMDYLLANLPLIRSQGVNGSAIQGDVAFPMVATVDVAREASERLARRDFEGHRVKLLLGPEDVSLRRATALLGTRLGLPDLPYLQFPPEGVMEALQAAGVSKEAAELLVAMQIELSGGRTFGGVERTPDTATSTHLESFLASALAGEAGPAA